MTSRILLACGFLATGIVYAVVAQEPSSVPLDFGDSVIAKNSNRIERALQQESECACTDSPLEEAMKYLEDQHQIKIWIDKQALEDEGIATDLPVTLSVSEITLQSLLSLMLKPIGLTHVIEDEVLKITTKAKADETLSTRIYPVTDLVKLEGAPDDYKSLIAVIIQGTEGKWMEIDGEGGAVLPLPNANSLVIRQSQRVHRDVDGLLAALRKAKQLQRISPKPEKTNVKVDGPSLEDPPRVPIRTRNSLPE